MQFTNKTIKILFEMNMVG